MITPEDIDTLLDHPTIPPLSATWDGDTSWRWSGHHQDLHWQLRLVLKDLPGGGTALDLNGVCYTNSRDHVHNMHWGTLILGKRVTKDLRQRVLNLIPRAIQQLQSCTEQTTSPTTTQESAI